MNQSVDLRDRILAAATGRFMEEGFSSVPLGELASGLGISKKTFYKHFTSKDELLLVVMDRLLEGVRGQIGSIVEGDASFLVKLETLVSFLGARLSQLSRPMLRDLERRAPGLWERLQQFRRERISNDFKGLLLRGVAEGYVRPDVDIDLFLLAFIGAVEAVVNPAVLAEQTMSVQDVIRSIMTLFFRGVLTTGAGEEFARLRSGKSGVSVPQSPGVP
jgi:AcrR family transcriptional regulator